MLAISQDFLGQSGDVRDVIIKGESKTIGFSCKNNHRAFKHSRLSGSIDFVRQWGISRSGASPIYWNAVKPIFAKLSDIRLNSAGTARWANLPNKIDDFYSPILSAFEDELNFQLEGGVEIQKRVSRALIDYVVGNQDFYKIIVKRNEVEVIGFNFHGDLNVPKSKYPTEIQSIERSPGHRNTTIIRFLEGHTFSLRIHSASSEIESSLKFDIQALALPSHQIYSNHILF